MLLQSHWIMNWFVSWGFIKHRMPLMLEGVGVWAYWLKHWPLSNQKISKEIATKSSPSIGWVGNFGVIGHFTSAGSIPTGARFSTASCPQWMAKTSSDRRRGGSWPPSFASFLASCVAMPRRTFHTFHDVFMFFCRFWGIEIPEVEALSQNNLTRYNDSTMLNDDTCHVLTGACLGGWATVATWRPYFSTVTWLIFGQWIGKRCHRKAGN